MYLRLDVQTLNERRVVGDRFSKTLAMVLNPLAAFGVGVGCGVGSDVPSCRIAAVLTAICAQQSGARNATKCSRSI